MAEPAGAPNAAGGQPNPNAPPHQPYSNKRLQQTQAQVDEVVDIMRVNVDKVLERDQKLSELDDRADQLQVQSRQFQTVTNKIRRKYFWQNVKMWIIIIGVVVVILVVIIVWVVSGQKPQQAQAPPPAAASIQPVAPVPQQPGVAQQQPAPAPAV